METHPVPQNISSYEFRLVGDMTLKQFLQLTLGVLLALGAMRLPILPIFKYPLAFMAVMLGVVLAFLPINNRPFSAWFSAFLKAIYSPTEFQWEATVPTVTTPTTPAPNTLPTMVPPQRMDSNPTPGQIISVYPQSSAFPNPLEFLKKLFSPKSQKTSPASVDSPPVLPTDTPPITPPTPTAQPVSQTPQVLTMQYTSTPKPNLPGLNISPQVTPTQTVFSKSPVTPQPPTAPVKTFQLPPNQPVNIITPNTPPKPQMSYAPTPNTPISNTPTAISPSIPTIAAAPITTTSPQAQLTRLIQTPTLPNILAGITAGPDNQPSANVTVEIIDRKTGIPSRALRSNKLGQFQIAIPLPAGSYLINAEKGGLLFEPVTIDVTNSIVNPIILIAKNS